MSTEQDWLEWELNLARAQAIEANANWIAKHAGRIEEAMKGITARNPSNVPLETLRDTCERLHLCLCLVRSAMELYDQSPVLVDAPSVQLEPAE